MVSAAPAQCCRQLAATITEPRPVCGVWGCPGPHWDTHLELGITYLRPAPPASHPIISDVFLPESGEVTSAPRTDPGVTSTRVS